MAAVAAVWRRGAACGGGVVCAEGMAMLVVHYGDDGGPLKSERLGITGCRLRCRRSASQPPTSPAPGSRGKAGQGRLGYDGAMSGSSENPENPGSGWCTGWVVDGRVGRVLSH